MAAKAAEPPAPPPRKGIFDALFGRGSFSGGDAPTAEQKALDKKTLWETLAPKAHGHGARSGRDIDAYDRHIGNIGPEGLGWQRPADEAALSTEELKATREYARDVETDSLEEVISACSENVRRYGVRARSISAPLPHCALTRGAASPLPAAQPLTSVNVRVAQFCVVDHVVPREDVAAAHWELSDDGGLAELQPDKSEITVQPTFAKALCHPAVVGIAKTLLDADCRIANVGHRNVASDDQAPVGERGGFGPAANRGPHGREWHT